MKFKIIKIAIYLFFVIGQSGASSLKFKNGLLGEYDQGLYSGPYNPAFRRHPNLRGSEFLDDHFNSNPFSHLFSSEMSSLNSFLKDELGPQVECTNINLSDNLEYLEYLARLLAISYLEHDVRFNKINLYGLGIDKSLCDIDRKFLVSNCAPSSHEMGLFIIRSRYVLDRDQDWSKYRRYSRDEIQRFLNEISQDSRNVFLQKMCPECDLHISKGVVEAFEKSCKWSKEKILEICSEKNELDEIFSFPKFANIFLNSNVFSVLNKNGQGSGCLKRMQILKKDLVAKGSLISMIMEHSFELLKNANYKEGDLFVAGSLRAFDERGLDAFLFEVEKSRPQQESAGISEKSIAPNVSPSLVSKPSTGKKIVEKEKNKSVEIVKPSPYISQFENALGILKNNSVEAAPIKMVEMKKDFVFTEKMRSALSDKLSIFQTRKALTDLKTLDAFGSEKSPVRLIFLKYLIDFEQHQGLFNIISVLGDEFYVVNDIEKKSEPVLMKLRNDETTRFQWQIDLIIKKSPLHN